MKIVAYRSSDDLDVEFIDDFHYIKEHQTYSNFRRGQVKNPYDKTVFSVGYLGAGKHKMQYPDTKSNTRTYMSWKNMLDRCYGKQNRNLHPAYFEISTVCDEWLNFQTFADWYEEKEYKVDGRLHLDKDILFPGNKIYAPDKCILVPQRINMLFVNKPNNRGLPNGIKKCVKGYSAKYNNEELGTYLTLDEAYSVYIQKKKEDVIKIANEYRNIIPDYVYDALIQYEFKIENDKNYQKTAQNNPRKNLFHPEVRQIKVYELMSKLEKLPSGTEVMCSGVKTLDDLTDGPPIGEDGYGNKEYQIIENIVDVDLEENRVYLQF